MNPELILCPATQLPCANKEYIYSLVENLPEGQLDMQLMNLPEGTPKAEGEALIQNTIESYEARRTTILGDLATECDGTLCGPVADIAVRYLYDGFTEEEARSQELS